MRVRRLDSSNEEDFYRLHCSAGGGEAWCHCVAWWVPTWEGWGERTSEENRALREQLFARGEHDGYLLYGDADGPPVGWCQAGPRDQWPKLTAQFELEPDPDAWAITCFLIRPEARGQGAATFLLQRVLADLRERGARRVEAFPKRGPDLDTLDLWNGPEVPFLRAGFRVVREDALRPVLSLDLAGTA